MKRWQTLLIGLVISAIFLVLVFLKADFSEMATAFESARYEWIVVTFVLLIGTVLIRGLRWSVLTQGRLKPIDAGWLFSIGFLFNNILPARIGEFARAFLTGRRPKMHFASALSSIVVERLFDFVSVAVMIGVVLIGLPLPDWTKIAGAAVGAGSVVGVILLAVAAKNPEWALNLGIKIIAVFPKVDKEKAGEFLAPIFEGLGGVSDLRTFALGLGLSIAAWVFSGITGWVLMLAFWDRMPLLVGQLAIAAAGLGVAVPGAPAGVGPYEYAVTQSLVSLGYDANIARSYAFTLHSINFIVTSILGGIGLMREGMSFGQVAEEARALRKQQAEEKPDSESLHNAR